MPIHSFSVEGIVHGPYRPLSGAEIARRQEYEYKRALSRVGAVTLQSMHQISEAAWAWSEAGRGAAASHLFDRAAALNCSLLNGIDLDPLQQ
jgi:hypothetical protein